MPPPTGQVHHATAITAPDTVQGATPPSEATEDAETLYKRTREGHGITTRISGPDLPTSNLRIAILLYTEQLQTTLLQHS